MMPGLLPWGCEGQLSVANPDYRALADKAHAEADAALLDNVRDRCLRSAAAFPAAKPNSPPPPRPKPPPDPVNGTKTGKWCAYESGCDC